MLALASKLPPHFVPFPDNPLPPKCIFRPQGISLVHKVYGNDIQN